MKKGVVLIMMFPLCIVLFSNAVYKHQHVLSDGQRVEHAHPFQSSSDTSGKGSGHQHTDREILLYTIISDSPVIVMFSPLFLDVYRKGESNPGALYPQLFFSITPVLHKLLRAPPCLS